MLFPIDIISAEHIKTGQDFEVFKCLDKLFTRLTYFKKN